MNIISKKGKLTILTKQCQLVYEFLKTKNAIQNTNNKKTQPVIKITAEDVAEANKRREIATQNCNVCPCCGEKEDEFYYSKQGMPGKGLSVFHSCKTWCEGIFHLRHMKVICYTCYTCGAQWESQPFEY